MSKADREVATSVAEALRSQAQQAGWAQDPVKWANDVLGVHLWSKQKEISESVSGNKRTVVASCHGTGKALDVDTLIPTPDGPTRMGDLAVGSKVYGADGSVVSVVATTGIHRSDRYRLTLLANGTETEVIASGNHLWPVMTGRGRARAEVPAARIMLPGPHYGTWHHLASNLDTRTLNTMLHQNHRLVIPGRVPVLRADAVPWHVEDWVTDIIRKRGVCDEGGRPAIRWVTHGSNPPGELVKVRQSLREAHVSTLLHRRKHNASMTWTLALCSMDAIEFLPDQNERALALNAAVDRQWHEYDPGPDGWEITSITRIEDGDVQCIQVDSPDHLYLCTEEGIPTHNSMIASVLACWWVNTRPPGDAIVVSCYTDDTEVLTKDGWKLFKNVRTGPDGDEFATRNPETKQFEWQHAFRYYEAPWDGEVVDVRGRSLDLRVTPNHRMVVQWSEYKNGIKTTGEIFKRADEIGPRGAELPALSKWDGKTPETVTFGKYTWATEDFAAFLGAWIAEGCVRAKRKESHSGQVVIAQLPGTKGYEPYRELLTRMFGKEPARDKGDKNWVFTCAGLHGYLERLGKAHTKYIPAEVKEWGSEALEKFLEFYLLGDGWFQPSQGKRRKEGYGSWRACTVSKRLADDLQEVAQKIGRSATITERQARDGGTFEGGRKILAENCRTGYYLIFGDSQTRRVKTSRSHYKGNVYCVSVPNETLYVRRGGKSIWCANTAPTYAQVNKILWEEIRKHHATAQQRGFPMIGRVTQGDEWKTDAGQVVAFGRKPATGDRHAFHGIHRRYVLVVIDEACGVPEEIWTGVEAITTTEGCRILAIGNPDDRNTEFGKVYLKPEMAHMWHRISVPAHSTPNFTGEPVPDLLKDVLVSKKWCEERLQAWGNKDPRYIAKVMAEFPDVSKSSLFAPSLVSQAFEDVTPQMRGGVLRLGVDVARFGSDSNVVVSYAGRTARVESTWSGTDTTSSAHQVLHLAEEIKDRTKSSWVEIRVDAVGLGAGVVDTLNARLALLPEPWYSVYEMHGSAAAPTDLGGSVHGYGNARAYWFDQLRQMMRNGSVKVDDHEALKDDLAIIFYTIRNGKLYIAPKEEMRAKHGRSPDFADALAYATAPVASGPQIGDTYSETAEDFARDLDDYVDDDLSIAPF